MPLISNINAIDSLIGSSWHSSPHLAVSLTYSFLQKLPADASSDDAVGFKPMNTVQITAAKAALALWSNVANITFTEVASNGNVQFGTNDQGNESAGYSYLPDTAHDPVQVYLNNKDSTNDEFSVGSYGLATMIHEIGHALGFKHPGNYNGTAGTDDGPFLPEDTDNGDYTIMSYVDPYASSVNDSYAVAPMLYDIQAMQYLYGANMNYHKGDDSYRFLDKQAPICIWDAGGSNTFDFSACNGDTIIDLNEGQFSSTAGLLFNVSIAYHVRIDHAIGGPGNDTIFTNDNGDVIDAGAGDDDVADGKGNDVVNGGAGNDHYYLYQAPDRYVVLSNGDTLVLRGEGTDTLSGFESFEFENLSVPLSALTRLAHPIGEQDALVGRAMSYVVPADTFTASGNTTLTLHAELPDGKPLPSWLSFDAASRTLSGTPLAANTGTLNVLIVAGAANMIGTAASFSVLVETPGISQVGTSGANLFVAGAGNDSFDGGAGLDQVSYAAAHTAYRITAGANGFSVRDLTGNGGTDSLVQIERLKFSDMSVAIDIDGAAGQTYRLYRAAFDRVPDDGGLSFWIAQADKGLSLNAMSTYFIASSEFVHDYGTLDNTQFVTQLYANVLHRAPDPAGLAFHVGHLDAGDTQRQDTLVAFSESNENEAAVVGIIGNGIPYTPYVG